MNIKDLRHKVIPKKAVPLVDAVYRKGRLAAVHAQYRLPARGLRVIAVTGTNGKTSTSCFLNDVLKYAGYTTALFTTAVIEMDGERSINTNHTTVPKTKDLFRFLKLAKVKNVDFVILEVTSHALHQHKMWGIPIEIAVMTNLTQDHLDYHGTMQSYADAKARLFGSYMKPRWCLLNADDKWFEFFKSISSGQVFTYGKAKGTDLQIGSLSASSKGVQMRLNSSDHSIITSTSIIGEFNGYNLAAVAGVCEILGIDPNTIRNGLGVVGAVPGRMEMVRSSVGFTTVVDYAHAPDALEKALLALRSATSNKVAVVFGATGDRDKTKRSIMGEIAAKYADKIYLTDDETYTENRDDIRKAVFGGIVEAKGRSKTIEIADRRDAIKKALQEAQKGDMVLVAGLGHQNYRAMNEGHIPWQEVGVVREVLRELGRQ